MKIRNLDVSGYGWLSLSGYSLNDYLQHISKVRDKDDNVHKGSWTECVMAQQGNRDNSDEEDDEEGEIVSHSGECLVGETNATAGIIMPVTVLLAGRNHQAENRRVVMDRFEK